MKLSIKKKNLFLIITGLNIFMCLVLLFVQPYSSAKNVDDALMMVITNRARNNNYKTLVLSYDGNSFNKEFMDEYYSYEMENKNISKNHSVLVSPSKLNNNELVFDDLQIKSSVIIKRDLLSDYSAGGNYKIRSDELWYFGQPLLPPRNNIKKHITVSENIANKLMEKSGLESFEALRGMTIDYKYYGEDEQLIEEKFFIRGVVISDKGVMPQYEELYGKDIIFMLDEFVSFKNIEAHFYFGGSLVNNKYTFKEINKINLGPVNFYVAENETNVDSIMVKEYEEYLKLTERYFLNNRATQIILIVLALIIIAANGFLLSTFKNTYSLLFLMVFGFLFINELATSVFAINKFSINWAIHNNIMRSGALLVYLLLMSIITTVLKEIKKKNEQD